MSLTSGITLNGKLMSLVVRYLNKEITIYDEINLQQKEMTKTRNKKKAIKHIRGDPIRCTHVTFME